MLEVNISELCLTTLNEKRTILNNIKFSIPSNKIYTILGKNGSGKSTLLKSLTGLLEEKSYKVEGYVLFEGQVLFSFEHKKLMAIRKDKIKYIFQDVVNSFDPLKKLQYYFELLVKNNEEIETTLDYFLLPGTEKIYSLHSYEVSGGMAQRISFALALLANPRLIILDEPTSGIDPAIANLFLLKLKEFADKNDNSVLLVTQDVTFAKKVSDKIAYLSEGTLSEFYTVRDFLTRKENQSLNQFLEANQKIES